MKNSFVMPNFISKKAQFYIYILVIYDITKFSALDGHNFPNLPLMKISSYHKAQGDSVMK